MKYLFILVSISSLAQSNSYRIREPVQGTVFYEITTNNIPIRTSIMGKIEIFTDSIQAFGITWEIQKRGKCEFVHDNVIEATYQIHWNGQLAWLIIKNEDVLLVLHRLFDIPMIQYPHQSKYYSDFP